MATAHEALAWMKTKAQGRGDRVLFRGQSKVYAAVQPSIARLAPLKMQNMFSICKWFVWAADGVTGYQIPNKHDRLAVLQHYIGRSPVIDLTATPEVALYFALLGATPGQDCVVYPIDQDEVKSKQIVFSSHSFLILPAQSGGARHRWHRQDGYSIGPLAWSDPNVVTAFDLLRQDGLDKMTFTPQPGDMDLVQSLGDLEEVDSDPLARAVRSVVTSIAQSLGLMTANSGITEILNSSKTRDANAELASEIDTLISMASTLNAPNELKTLRSLRAAIGSTWDTSFDASLDAIRSTLRNRA